MIMRVATPSTRPLDPPLWTCPFRLPSKLCFTGSFNGRKRTHCSKKKETWMISSSDSLAISIERVGNRAWWFSQQRRDYGCPAYGWRFQNLITIYCTKVQQNALIGFTPLAWKSKKELLHLRKSTEPIKHSQLVYHFLFFKYKWQSR